MQYFHRHFWEAVKRLDALILPAFVDRAEKSRASIPWRDPHVQHRFFPQ